MMSFACNLVYDYGCLLSHSVRQLPDQILNKYLFDIKSTHVLDMKS